MPEAVVVSKDPRKVRAGLAGASKRWSDPANRRVVRLADLLPEEADVVRSLLALAQRRRERDASEPAAESASASA